MEDQIIEVVVMVEVAMFVAEVVIMGVKVAMVANLIICMRQATMNKHLCLPEAEVSQSPSPPSPFFVGFFLFLLTPFP